MKLVLAAPLAAAVLAIGAFGTSVHAQALPPGSYQSSCTQLHWAGTTLVAECRRRDGGMAGTGLREATRCRGDIANNDGQLICVGEAGSRAPAPPPPNYGQRPPEPGYGQRPPEPGYGPRGNDEARERCEEMGRREREVRERLETTPYGPERERLEVRMREVRENRERSGCRG